MFKAGHPAVLVDTGPGLFLGDRTGQSDDCACHALISALLSAADPPSDNTAGASGRNVLSALSPAALPAPGRPGAGRSSRAYTAQKARQKRGCLSV